MSERPHHRDLCGRLRPVLRGEHGHSGGAGRRPADGGFGAGQWPSLARHGRPNCAGVARTQTSACISTSRSAARWGRCRPFAPEGTFPPVSTVVLLALRRKLPLAEIRAEIDRQLDSFETVMGRRPDYVDGHQHVHGLPGVRDALIEAMAARGLAGRVWLRNAADGLHRIVLRGAHAPKTLALALAVQGLSSGFRRAARRQGFATNDGFSGHSVFDPGEGLRTSLRDLSSRTGAPPSRHVPSRPCGRRAEGPRPGDHHPRAGTRLPALAAPAAKCWKSEG